MILNKMSLNRYYQRICCCVFGAVLAISSTGMLSFFANTAAADSPAAVKAQPSSHIITIYDGGREQSIITKASTVQKALEEFGARLDKQHDIVEPGLDTPITNNGFKINIYRARTITIVEGARRMRVNTAAQTPTQIAQAAGIVLYREDKVRFTPPVDVALDGSSLLMRITRATRRTVTAEEEIDFPVEQTRDDSQPLGYRQVKQAGAKGLRKLTYKVEARDGAEISRQQISSEIIKQPKKQIEVIGTKPKNPLTKGKGAQIFTDSKGVAHRETYYDLPMNIVANACGGGGYTVRADGAKVDKDGYILVAANYGNYPRCSVVETSMGPGKVYDTGGFAARHPHGFDLATDWTNGDGR